MRVTMKDVALYAGVSLKTVSRVVNCEENVSEETRAKVLQSIEELGFVAYAPASRLARGRSSVLGMILPYVESPYSSILLQSVLKQSNELSYSVIVQPLPAIEEKAIIELCLGGQVDGIIIGEASHYERKLLIKLANHNIPHVLIQPNKPLNSGISTFSIQITDRDGVAQATEYLVDLGHTRIGFVAYDLELTYCKERLMGYREEINKNYLPYDDQLLYIGDGKFSGGYLSAQYFLNLKERPTAIITTNDEMAVGAMHAIYQAGLRIPEHISIVGFDDIPLASQLYPTLSTVHQPIGEIGESAVKILVEMIEKKVFKPNDLTLSTKLIIRESTGFLPK
jgi:LacI family transcriptional regulator